MHDAAMAWVAECVARFDLAGRDVLDLGGRDINGTPRHLFNGRYVVVDIKRGGGVDIVADAATFDLGERFAVVVCTELFEHTPDGAAIVGPPPTISPTAGCSWRRWPAPAGHRTRRRAAVAAGELYRNVEPGDLEDWLGDGRVLRVADRRVRHRHPLQGGDEVTDYVTPAGVQGPARDHRVDQHDAGSPSTSPPPPAGWTPFTHRQFGPHTGAATARHFTADELRPRLHRRRLRDHRGRGRRRRRRHLRDDVDGHRLRDRPGQRDRPQRPVRLADLSCCGPSTRSGSRRRNRRRAVRVTAKWGWPAVPADVIEATYLFAHRLSYEVGVPGGIERAGPEFGLPGYPAAPARTPPRRCCGRTSARPDRASMTTALAAVRTDLYDALSTGRRVQIYRHRQETTSIPAIVVGWPQSMDVRPAMGDPRDFVIDVFVAVEVTDPESSDDLLSDLLEAGGDGAAGRSEWDVQPVTDFVEEQPLGDGRVVMRCRLPVAVFA